MAIRAAKCKSPEYNSEEPADTLCRAYGFASRTDEMISGRLAEDFCGPARWSRALDFPVEGWPEFKGLRYKDFKDCTNTHVLFKDGESCGVYELSDDQVKRVIAGLDEHLAKKKIRRVKAENIPLQRKGGLGF